MTKEEIVKLAVENDLIVEVYNINVNYFMNGMKR